jgi:thiamine-monophosphate kinase
VNELDLIDWLRPRLPMRADVELGAGDDCALVRPDGGPLAVTVDQLLEGVHFRPEDDPAAVGWKTLAVSLSDLAAMGCAPRWAVTALGMRRGAAEDWPRRFAEGLGMCAREYGVALVGGDYTVGDGPISVSLTAIGSPFNGGPARRDGARAGDVLAVTGALGGSIRGRHLRFAPRLAESRSLCAHGGVRAMMDLSDGLAADLPRFCRASGVGARVHAATLPVHPDVPQAGQADPAYLHAMQDGEDFELLVALAPGRIDALMAGWPHPTPLTVIGECAGAADELVLVDPEGNAGDWPGGGYVHGDD